MVARPPIHTRGATTRPPGWCERTEPRPADDWRWQLRHAVSSVAELASRLRLSADELAGARRAEREGMRIRITPHYLSLCHPTDPSCPIRRQVVPHAAEARRVAGDLVDPLGEQAHLVAPQLVRRYPDRALLLVSDACAIHCRFCTRSRLVGGGRGALAPAALAPALAYLARTPAVREVIVSGGEPLAMSTRRLDALLGALRQSPHVELIRLATRAPACLPQRITPELLTALRAHQPLWVMSHFNHPAELCPAACRALDALCDAGLPVMNQTVLLAGVNDRAAVLEQLFRALVRRRVRPYYLHHMDPVAGTAHLRTPLDKSIALLEQLQGRLSGIALPKLMVDTPGGHGKVPVGPRWIVSAGAGRTRLRTYQGTEVEVLDPPLPVD